MPVKTTVHGEVELRRKMMQVVTDLRGEEYASAMRTTVLLLERDAKLFAPVDQGRLKSSITSDVRMSEGPGGGTVQGIVGTNVEHGPAMELGTGTVVGRPPHFPPAAALEVWARRHGFPKGGGFLVARAIFKKGGLQPRRYFERSFEKNKPRIIEIHGDVVTRIVRK